MISNSGLQNERDVKLEVIRSISRSQHALARILESIAEISSYSEDTALTLANQMDRITRYQQVMASMLLNVELPPLNSGIPSAPWLNRNQGVFMKYNLESGEADH